MKQKSMIACMLLTLILSACGGKATATQPGVDAMMTSGVGTMVASFFGTQTAMVTPATATFTPSITPIPTSTALPPSPIPFSSPTRIYSTPTYIYLTPTRTGTQPTVTINPASLASGCNNLAFIRDVTIDEGTTLQRRENFTKTWKVQNTGTCEWVYQYHLVLLSGDDFGAGPTNIGRVVAPGDWAEISINMDAPKNAGTYTSYWRMADTSGNMFGATLAVSIDVVEDPTETP